MTMMSNEHKLNNERKPKDRSGKEFAASHETSPESAEQGGVHASSRCRDDS